MAFASSPSRDLALADLRKDPERTLLRYDRSGWGLLRYAQGAGVRHVAEWVANLPPGGPTPTSDLRDAVGEDLQVALGLLARTASREVAIVLPEGMDLAVALAGIRAAGREADLHSLALAVEPATLEDLLCARDRLRDRGFAACVQDRRTLGEFAMANLLAADAVALVGVALPAADREGAGALLGHLAPWAEQVATAGVARGGFDSAELAARAEPGALFVAARLESTGGVRTELFSLTRPLHSARLAERLPAICAGAVFSRGKLWLAAAPERRLGWWGVGPEVGFDDAGPWLPARVFPPLEANAGHALDWRPHLGDRGTRLAFTGREVDSDEIATLLRECALDDAEFEALGAGTLHDGDPAQLAEPLHRGRARRASG